MENSYIEIKNGGPLTVLNLGRKVDLDSTSFKILYTETEDTLFSLHLNQSGISKISFERLQLPIDIDLGNGNIQSFDIENTIFKITFNYSDNTKIIMCNKYCYKNHLLTDEENLVLQRYLTSDTSSFSRLVDDNGEIDYHFSSSLTCKLIITDKFKLLVSEDDKLDREFKAKKVSLSIVKDDKWLEVAVYTPLFFILFLLLFFVFLIFAVPSLWFLTHVVVWSLVIIVVVFTIKVVIEFFK